MLTVLTKKPWCPWGNQLWSSKGVHLAKLGRQSLGTAKTMFLHWKLQARFDEPSAASWDSPSERDLSVLEHVCHVLPLLVPHTHHFWPSPQPWNACCCPSLQSEALVADHTQLTEHGQHRGLSNPKADVLEEPLCIILNPSAAPQNESPVQQDLSPSFLPYFPCSFQLL